MTAGTVVLVRHGVTDWNAQGRFQGQSDVPLNETGRAQAAAMARRLPERTRPTSIISSDLGRAVDTASALADACGLEVTTDARLREVNVGSWEGLTMADLADQAPELDLDGLDGEFPDDFRWSPVGETGLEATTRVVAAIREHAEALDVDGVLAVVGHGAVLRNAVVRLMGVTAQLTVMSVMRNCGWAVLRPRATYWRLVAYNQTA